MSQEFPESGLVKKTFTLRVMDFPPEIAMTKRSLVRWFALAFGLISEKESRSTILEVLDSLFQVANSAEMNTHELLTFMKSHGKEIDEKLLRYHLKRLVNVGLIERKRGGKLSFPSSPTADKQDIVAGFKHNISIPVQQSLDSIGICMQKISESYVKKD